MVSSRGAFIDSGVLAASTLLEWNGKTEVPEPAITDSPALWGGAGAWVRGASDDGAWLRYDTIVRRCVEPHDFFFGVAGAAATFTGPGVPLSARTTLEYIYGQTSAALESLCGSQTAINLGLAHGLAGCLLGWEIAAGLLGRDLPELRSRAIQRILSAADSSPDADSPWARSCNADYGLSLCNGAAGIVVAAACGFRYSGASEYGELLELGLPSLMAIGYGSSFCCGTLGHGEALVEAYRTTDEPELLRGAAKLLHSVERTSLLGDMWQKGTLGLDVLARRIEEPLTTDLPGLPMELTPLQE